MEMEKWKEEVMGSLQGMKQAEPNHFLFTRIEAHLAKKYGRVAVWQVRLAAAAMIVLVIVNSVALLRKQESSSAANEYQLSVLQNY